MSLTADRAVPSRRARYAEAPYDSCDGEVLRGIESGGPTTSRAVHANAMFVLGFFEAKDRQMLTRRDVVTGSLVALLSVRATEARTLPRIGVLTSNTLSDAGVEQFRRALADRGWVDGRSVVIDSRTAEGRLNRLPLLAAELVRLKPNVVCTTSEQAALAILRVTESIPVVTIAGDAVGQGLTSSLRRPDRNVTGLTLNTPETAAKRLQLLKEAIPAATRVAVLRCGSSTWAEWPATQEAARALNIDLLPFIIRRESELPEVFDQAVKQRADALMVFHCALFGTIKPSQFVDRRLPTIYPVDRYVSAGGLLVYAPDTRGILAEGAGYVDKILRGAKPSELPMQQPTKFRFVVNLKTAKTLGLTIPPSVVLQADEVIQ